MSPELETILRGLSAATCGVVLGLPYRKRPGGISTHVLVALGAFVYCEIAKRLGTDDMLRVVQGVAQGVGFIGAAAVIKTRKYIVGITTAASIWIAGAIGCATVFVVNPLHVVTFATATAVVNGLVRRGERRVFDRSRRIAPQDSDSPSD